MIDVKSEIRLAFWGGGGAARTGGLSTVTCIATNLNLHWYRGTTASVPYNNGSIRNSLLKDKTLITYISLQRGMYQENNVYTATSAR